MSVYLMTIKQLHLAFLCKQNEVVDLLNPDFEIMHT